MGKRKNKRRRKLNIAKEKGRRKVWVRMKKSLRMIEEEWEKDYRKRQLDMLEKNKSDKKIGKKKFLNFCLFKNSEVDTTESNSFCCLPWKEKSGADYLDYENLDNGNLKLRAHKLYPENVNIDRLSRLFYRKQ